MASAIGKALRLIAEEVEDAGAPGLTHQELLTSVLQRLSENEREELRSSRRGTSSRSGPYDWLIAWALIRHVIRRSPYSSERYIAATKNS